MRSRLLLITKYTRTDARSGAYHSIRQPENRGLCGDALSGLPEGDLSSSISESEADAFRAVLLLSIRECLCICGTGPPISSCQARTDSSLALLDRFFFRKPDEPEMVPAVAGIRRGAAESLVFSNPIKHQTDDRAGKPDFVAFAGYDFEQKQIALIRMNCRKLITANPFRFRCCSGIPE